MRLPAADPSALEYGQQSCNRFRQGLRPQAMQVAEKVPVVVYRRKLKKYSAEGVDLFRFRGGVPLRQFRPTLESTMGCLAGEKHDLRLSARSYALRPCNKNPASRALKVDIQSARTATEVWGRRYKEALPRRHKGSRGLSISCFSTHETDSRSASRIQLERGRY